MIYCIRLLPILLAGVLVQAGNRDLVSPCPGVFKYVRYSGSIAGRITLPVSSHGNFKIAVILSLKANATTKGNLLWLGKDEKPDAIFNRGYTSFRVIFPRGAGIPKVTKIFKNQEIICNGSSETSDTPGQSIRNIKLFRNIAIRPPGSLGQTRAAAARVITTSPPEVQGIVLASKFGELDTSSGDNIFQCGTINSSQGFIVGGDETLPGQWPWLVTINLVAEEGKYICSGNLVSSVVVVTAAHCMVTPYNTKRRAREFFVQLGVHNRLKLDDNSKIRYVNTVIFPPGYTVFNNIYKDVAVLVLEDPIEFTKYIRPICLWSGSHDTESIVGLTGIVAGWGRDETGQDAAPDLRVTKVPIVSNQDSDCIKLSQIISEGDHYCAGRRDGNGVCNGDSGAGMFLWRGNRWEMRGLVSHGSLYYNKNLDRTCDLTKYVAYTNLANYIPWIQAIVKKYE